MNFQDLCCCFNFLSRKKTGVDDYEIQFKKTYDVGKNFNNIPPIRNDIILQIILPQISFKDLNKQLIISKEWKNFIEHLYLQRIKQYLSNNPYHIHLQQKQILNLSFNPELIQKNQKQQSQIMKIGIDSLTNNMWQSKESKSISKIKRLNQQRIGDQSIIISPLDLNNVQFNQFEYLISKCEEIGDTAKRLHDEGFNFSYFHPYEQQKYENKDQFQCSYGNNLQIGLQDTESQMPFIFKTITATTTSQNQSIQLNANSRQRDNINGKPLNIMGINQRIIRHNNINFVEYSAVNTQEYIVKERLYGYQDKQQILKKYQNVIDKTGQMKVQDQQHFTWNKKYFEKLDYTIYYE